jgi:hypothetical protein
MREFVVESVIARDDRRVVPLEQFAMLEERRSVRDAESLHFIAARNDDAVVVREHDDRTILQFGIYDSLARRVEVVAVDDGDGGVGVHII